MPGHCRPPVYRKQPVLRGELVGAENPGTMSLVSVNCDGTLIGVTVPEQDEPRPGSPVALSAPPPRVLLYAEKIGELVAHKPAAVA